MGNLGNGFCLDLFYLSILPTYASSGGPMDPLPFQGASRSLPQPYCRLTFTRWRYSRNRSAWGAEPSLPLAPLTRSFVFGSSSHERIGTDVSKTGASIKISSRPTDRVAGPSSAICAAVRAASTDRSSLPVRGVQLLL